MIGTGILTGAPAVVLGTVMLGGAVLYSGGAVNVSVDEKRADGHHIHVLVPAMVLPLGLKFIPNRHLQKAPPELRRWLPAIEAAAEELERCPDGPFVEVDNPNEKVSIAKRGDSLEIDVDSPRETVHVSFPLKTVLSLVRELEAAGPTV